MAKKAFAIGVVPSLSNTFPDTLPVGTCVGRGVAVWVITLTVVPPPPPHPANSMKSINPARKIKAYFDILLPP